jgi:2-polyprenyl-3-methyl-5-hydroxy-6-metoxy-1,4-benzoquinol methylase
MYKEFFETHYSLIRPFIKEADSLLEIGCRDDRGALSAGILSYSSMTILDKDEERVKLAKKKIIWDASGATDIKKNKINFIVSDIFSKEIINAGRFDVVMTTALLHHTPKENTHQLLEVLGGLSNKRVIVSGPNKRKQPTLYGDHQYHLDRKELKETAARVGLTEVAYLEHDDLAPPVSFFGESAAKEMAVDGVSIIVYDKN